jgi:hypothetical protein
MLSIQEATAVAERILIKDKTFRNDNERIVIPANFVTEIPHAWIFHYTTIGALAGNINYALGGNSPLFIDKKDGRVSTFPSYLSPEGMIVEYEEVNKCWQLQLMTDIYTSASKMLLLKKLLQLTQTDLTRLKTNKTLIIDSGAQKRLNKIAISLQKEGIPCEVTLSNI